MRTVYCKKICLSGTLFNPASFSTTSVAWLELKSHDCAALAGRTIEGRQGHRIIGSVFFSGILRKFSNRCDTEYVRMVASVAVWFAWETFLCEQYERGNSSFLIIFVGSRGLTCGLTKTLWWVVCERIPFRIRPLLLAVESNMCNLYTLVRLCLYRVFEAASVLC